MAWKAKIIYNLVNNFYIFFTENVIASSAALLHRRVYVFLSSGLVVFIWGDFASLGTSSNA